MSKLAEALKAEKKIYNDHGLIKTQPESFAVAYHAHQGRMTSSHGWYLWSPSKQWPGHWSDYGKFAIRQDDHKSLSARDVVAALRIASKESSVLRWSPSPFSPRTAFVPTSALEAHGIKPTRVFDFTEPGTSPSSAAPERPRD